MAQNVLGEVLEPCNFDPVTGFYRDGCCNTGAEDVGVHTVCTRVTAEFLAFSASVGNDLSTPHPEFGFDGLQPGDQWCLCAPRWQEAFEGLMSRIAGRFTRVESRRRAPEVGTRPAVGPAAQELLDHRRAGRRQDPGRHAAPARAGQVGRRPGPRRRE